MALYHSPRIVTDGLVLCLDAANVRSYPGTGTSWFDLSGNGNTGTLTNGPTFNSGNGGSIVFDGSNDYISTNFTYANNSTFSMSCWINASVSQRCGLIGIRRAYRATDWYQATIYITGDEFAGTSGTGLQIGSFGPLQTAIRAQFFPSANITDGNWKLITMSSGTDTDKIYINDQLLGESASSILPTRFEAANFLIGVAGNYPNGVLAGYYFNGKMTGISFYNRALSAAEISQNFNATRNRFGV